jgi:hypothetical protein
VKERPNDPFVLFNLGQSAVEKRAWHEALGYLGRSLAGSAPSDLIVRKIYALIARVHQTMGNLQDTPRLIAFSSTTSSPRPRLPITRTGWWTVLRPVPRRRSRSGFRPA